MNQIFLVIEHCNGEIMSDPIIIKGEKIIEYMHGEYLIYQILLPGYKLKEIK